MNTSSEIVLILIHLKIIKIYLYILNSFCLYILNLTRFFSSFAAYERVSHAQLI